jgi:DNA-binding CsgD family transcriptional regulator
MVYLKYPDMKNNVVIHEISRVYFELLNLQKFSPDEIDYSLFEEKKVILQNLANIGNSGVSVFDVIKKEHIFYSPNFGVLLGYDLAQIEQTGHVFLDKKIHPVDFVTLMQNGISILKLFFQFSEDEKLNYKLINEYRIMNSGGQYIRIIEQHQALTLTKSGKLWLNLSTIDISPNQDVSLGLKAQLLNFRTGKTLPFEQENILAKNFDTGLSPREIQILQMVKDGLLSKEISDELNISLHTVNTHRQRILEKLGANNSMEAIVFASRMGLL